MKLEDMACMSRQRYLQIQIPFPVPDQIVGVREQQCDMNTIRRLATGIFQGRDQGRPGMFVFAGANLDEPIGREHQMWIIRLWYGPISGS